MNLIFRQGILNDLNEIEELVKNAIIQMDSQGIEQWDKIYPVREDFEQDIRNKQLFVGTIGNKIVVTYTLNKDYDEEYNNGQWKNPDKSFFIIHRLCVDVKFQNKGIARLAMEHAEKNAVLYHGQAIRLDVFSNNPYAIKLYQNCGYEKVGTAKWRKGIFYLMEKYL